MRIRLGVAAMLAAASLATAGIGSVSAAGNTLRIDPVSGTVAKDQMVTVKIIQGATVATSGAQMTLTFDRTKVQVVTVTRGAPYASSTLFLGADAVAINAANGSGKLKTVAAALLPPSSVPAGDQEFLLIQLKGIACGDVKLGLPAGSADGSLLDGRESSYGAALKVATTGATLTVTGCGGGGGAGTPSAGASQDPATQTPLPSGAVEGETGSPDAFPSVDPGIVLPGGSSAAGESLPPDSGASPAPSFDAVPAADVAGAQAERRAWMDFALASLAVAAAGIALLIVVVIAVAMIGSLVALYLVIRALRRPSQAAPDAAHGMGVQQPDETQGAFTGYEPAGYAAVAYEDPAYAGTSAWATGAEGPDQAGGSPAPFDPERGDPPPHPERGPLPSPGTL